MYHLCWTIAGVNAYADHTRLNLCGTISLQNKEGGEEASAMLDPAIAIATIYHMIEWIRWTLLLTSCLVSVNLIGAFNVLGINWVFGFISLIISTSFRYSETGNECALANKQPTRAQYLSLQPLCFVLSFVFTFGHLIFMRMKGRVWCHDIYLSEGEQEED